MNSRLTSRRVLVRRAERVFHLERTFWRNSLFGELIREQDEDSSHRINKGRTQEGYSNAGRSLVSWYKNAGRQQERWTNTMVRKRGELNTVTQEEQRKNGGRTWWLRKKSGELIQERRKRTILRKKCDEHWIQARGGTKKAHRTNTVTQEEMWWADGQGRTQELREKSAAEYKQTRAK